MGRGIRMFSPASRSLQLDQENTSSREWADGRALAHSNHIGLDFLFCLWGCPQPFTMILRGAPTSMYVGHPIWYCRPQKQASGRVFQRVCIPSNSYAPDIIAGYAALLESGLTLTQTLCTSDTRLGPTSGFGMCMGLTKRETCRFDQALITTHQWGLQWNPPMRKV